MRIPAILVAIVLAGAFPSVGKADEEALRRIVGQYGWEAVQATTVRAALPADIIVWLDANLHTSPRTELLEDRYLIITGCRQHACGAVEAFVAIDVIGGGWLMAKTDIGKAGISMATGRVWESPATVASYFQHWKDHLR